MVRRLCSLNTQFSSQYRMLATINERLGVLNAPKAALSEASVKSAKPMALDAAASTAAAGYAKQPAQAYATEWPALPLPPAAEPGSHAWRQTPPIPGLWPAAAQALLRRPSMETAQTNLHRKPCFEPLQICPNATSL
ncbi:MAG: hypothetical protein FRX49_03931 [Trebouxia sp. A1-2]|nr:MAG: hypothetical protein FRX49_03931 [Trebouxia sp. A1-2]